MLAQLDLIDVGEYLQSQNPEAAGRVIRRIQAAAKALGEFPHVGRRGRVEGTRELVVTGTLYVIPYRINGQTVEILRVYHGTMRWPDKF
ncbi:MAG: type II toxin-antitoxin system RelE/ParE family toxin [Sphingomonadales bacterium]